MAVNAIIGLVKSLSILLSYVNCVLHTLYFVIITNAEYNTTKPLTVTVSLKANRYKPTCKCYDFMAAIYKLKSRKKRLSN